jgi:predicted transcriptional regulator
LLVYGCMCNMYDMKRTTIFIDEATERRLREAARRTSRPMASVVRDAINVYLDLDEPRPSGLPSVTGRFSSGRSDTSEQVDDLLWSDPHA